MVLDVRVQAGGSDVAKWLESYGRGLGVTVKASEFK